MRHLRKPEGTKLSGRRSRDHTDILFGKALGDDLDEVLAGGRSELADGPFGEGTHGKKSDSNERMTNSLQDSLGF